MIEPGQADFSGKLQTQVIRAHKPHKAKSLRVPGLGRIIFTRDKGESTLLASEVMSSNVTAHHFDGDGKLIHEYDLGSGLVTNVGVTALANDFAWAAPSGAAVRTLGFANQHATGTGSTAAAASDIKLQTVSTNGGQNPVAGTQSLVSGANSQVYKTVATINYTGTEAVTEWGLHSSSTLSSTTGSPFTNVTATTGTVTGTPYTASSSTVQGEQMFIVVAGTTASYGLILSNTSSVLTIPAWYKTADGTAGSTPGNTETFTLRPTMWDHKVFSAINVVNGDSIQFSYSLTINSGG